jgi:hypothetical protein
MQEQHDHLEALTHIRDMMQRSSRFLSLSGLSGVFSGFYAIAGAVVAWIYMHDVFVDFPLMVASYFRDGDYGMHLPDFGFYRFFALDAGLVLLLSLLTGWYFSKRKAKKMGVVFWDKTAWMTLLALAIPLAAGALFCFALLWHGIIGLIAPATLIFYGLALLNASKYTLNDIRYLGISEIALGLLACMFVGYGLFFWVLGFGVLHIIYGTAMWWKYER